MSNPFTLYVIAGPTASGKSALAEKLAIEFHIPIISADSRQFFNEVYIGTARPQLEHMPEIEYYTCGHKSIHDKYNAGDFEKEVIALIRQWKGKYTHAILCGGSGLYIKAVCEGFDELPEADLEFRTTLEAIHLSEGIQGLVKLLPSEIYKSLNESDNKNPQRLMRHIEIFKQGGMRKTTSKERDFKIEKYLIELPREKLYEQINHRVDLMIAAGLLKEVKSVYEYKTLNSLQTVGYTELFDYMEGKYSLDFAIDKIKQHTRNFAKRQITWFNKDTDYFKGSAEELYQQIRKKLSK